MRSSRTTRASRALQTTRLSIAGHVSALFALIVVGFLPVAHAVTLASATLTVQPVSSYKAATSFDADAAQQITVFQALAQLCSGVALDGDADDGKTASSALGPCIACAAPALAPGATIDGPSGGEVTLAPVHFSSHEWISWPHDWLSRLQPRAPPAV